MNAALLADDDLAEETEPAEPTIYGDGSDPLQFHQYDDQPDELPADETLAEATMGELTDNVEPSVEHTLEVVREKFPRALQDTRGMLKKMARISGHQSGYDDSPKVDQVDEQIEARRQAISEEKLAFNAEFEALGGKWHDEKRDLPREPRKDATTEVKAIAAILGCPAHQVWYPRHISTAPLSTKLRLIRQVLAETANLEQAVEQEDGGVEMVRPNLARVWNRLVFGLQEKQVEEGGQKRVILRRDLANPQALRAPHTMRYDGTPTICRDPKAPQQVGLTGIVRRQKDQSGVAKSATWKEAAENHEALYRLKRGPGSRPGEKEQIHTRCGMTGESLVLRRGSRFRSWRIGPSIKPDGLPYALGLKAARLMVDAAAILTLPTDQLSTAYGFEMKGAQIEGTMPEFVHQISVDGDAWAILAAHTEHPVWAKYAKFLMALRDALYFRLDEQEYREAAQLGEQIAEELRAAYPDQFFDQRVAVRPAAQVQVQEQAA